MSLFRRSHAAWRFVSLVCLSIGLSTTAQSQSNDLTVTVDDPEFISDLADGMITRNHLELKIALLGAAAGDSEYRYKFGLVPQRCRFDRGTYSSWRSTNQRLIIDAPDTQRPVELCLQGRSADGTSSIESYKWRTVALPVAVIFAPVSPSTTSTPTVKWSDVKDVVGYDLDVSRNPDCSQPEQSFSNIQAAYQMLAPLADGTYYACVYSKALKNNGDTVRRAAANNPYMWTQDAGAVPGPFNITGPATPSTSTAPTVTWSASEGAEAYDLTVATDSTCANIVQVYSDLTATSQPLASLPDGSYYACLTASNAAGITTAQNSPYGWEQMTSPPGAFSIIAPGSLSSDVTPIVQWEAAEAASAYDLIIATDASCSSVVQSLPGLTTTSVELASLSDGVYYACLSASNAAGSTSASNSPYEWTQLTSAPGDFSITSPASPSLTTTPTVSWSSAQGADKYDLVVAADAGCVNPVQSYAAISGTSQTLAPLADGVYFACVTAINQIGSTSAVNDSYSWEQVTAAPAPFSILSPSGAVSTSTPEITWEAAASADSYHLIIATDSACSAAVVEELQITGQTYTPQPLAEGTYFTCITATNAYGTTAASNDGLSFVFDITAPGDFLITAPTGIVDTTDTVVMWEASEGATTYDLFISINPECTDEFRRFDDLTLTSQDVTGMSDRIYYACLTAFDSAGNATQASNSPFSFEVVLPVVEPHVMFITSELYLPRDGVAFPPAPPYFDGLYQADWLCTAHAEAGGLIDWDGTEPIYRALLWTSTTEAIARIGGLRADIVNIRGELIAAGEADLYSALHNAVMYDEHGNPPPYVPIAWTGANPDGTSSSFTCNDWNGTSSLSGSVGDPLSSSTSWLSIGHQPCNDLARLYCISP